MERHTTEIVFFFHQRWPGFSLPFSHGGHTSVHWVAVGGVVPVETESALSLCLEGKEDH